MKNLLLVLHAHLPWGHLADRDDPAARWLFEATVDCYQPLLEALERLDADGVPFRITLSVSAPLAAMWGAPLFAPRLAEFVDAQTEKYAQVPPAYAAARAFHLERLHRPPRDLIEGFENLKQVELICSTATHGFLPLLSSVPIAARAQIEVAAQNHGGPLPGMWLAECGYCPAADRWLRDAGVSYCFVDSHAVAHAEFKHHRPVRTAAGLHAFARDPLASEQVWSRQSGYPGDRAYLDFHHRVEGCRVLKVPGDAAWDPVAARHKAQVHARHFVEQRALTDAEVIVAPYDAELFGHWWFEGPDFLEEVIRAAAASPSLKLATGSDHLAEFPDPQPIELPTSSWGRDGYSAVWLDEKNAWMWPHLHRAAEKLAHLAGRESSGPIHERALAQATRELMLAQSSDWPFLIEASTNGPYATARFQDHLLAFQSLAAQLQTGAIQLESLQRREATNNLFGSIDARVYGGKSWPQR